MKLLFSVLSVLPLALCAQVGIGTATPAASAKLEVSASDKGFLAPRVSLTGTADVTTIAAPATGLLVYNLTTAGTAPANVTPGFYYYDGSKWQRISNQQPDATVDFNTANPNSGSPVFAPNTPQSKDVVYISTVDNSQWVWNGTAYVTYTPPPNTAWYTQSSTTDAGANKAGGIYRTGNVGIGTGSFSPAAKLDIRTSAASTGFRLQDGTQGTGKVLTSDANGSASWATNVAITPAVVGTLGAGYSGTSTALQSTGASITLPPGKWNVQTTMLIRGTVQPVSGQSAWVRAHYATTANGAMTGDVVAGTGGYVSGSLVGPTEFGMATGSTIINNTSGSNKIYYLVKAIQVNYGGYTLDMDRFGSSAWSENSIVAFPMN